MRIALILTLMIFCYTGVTQAQSDWHVVIHNNADGQLYTINAEGMTNIDLPVSPLSVNYVETPSVYGRTVVASTNGRYLAYLTGESQIQIVDMQSDACCKTIANPYADKSQLLDSLWLAAINPDGTAVAISVRYLDGTNTDSFDELAIVPLEGDTIFYTDLCRPVYGRWLDDGIEMVDVCDFGDAPTSASFDLWNPSTGQRTTSEFGILSFGEHLFLTGEQIRLAPDYNLPYGGERGLHSPLNTLQYSPSANGAFERIYVTTSDVELQRPHWVADGHAVLLHSFTTDSGEVLFRDSSIMPIQYANLSHFIAGTPDGWLILDTVTHEIIHYRVDESQEIEIFTLGQLEASPTPSVYTLYKPDLGASMIQTGFTTVPQILVTSTPAYCPDALPAQLTIGSTAQVIPGSANNVRSQPSTASELVGQIPSGEYFTVLDGPRCGDSMAWWRVDYEGLIGWTSEGQGDEYWLDGSKG